jgi:hypothetical protein
MRNSGKSRSYPFTFSVGAADTWELKTITVAGDTSGSWLADAGVGLYLAVCIAAGSSRLGAAGAWTANDYSGVGSTTNGVGATSDAFQITGLVVLPGIDLTALDQSLLVTRAPLIQRSFDQELAAAQRYWEKSYDYGTAPGTVDTAGASFIAIRSGATVGGTTAFYKVQKRATPAVTMYSTQTGASGKIRDANAADQTPAFAGSGLNSFQWYYTSTAAADGFAYGQWKSDARL